MDEKGYDLHTHTGASDGWLSPRECVELARREGLKGLAVTDHDTVAGVAEAVSAGNELGIEVVPGVEISTMAYDEDVHILGLWVEHQDETLITRLSSNRDVRYQRNQAMMQKLRDLGFDVHLEEAERIASERRGNGDGSVNRPHIAELLVRKGIVASVKEAFDVYLGEGGEAYVAVERISPEEAVQWIHEAGGIAVLAHPGLYRNAEQLIGRLADRIDGIEAAHADHDEAQERMYRKIAADYGFAVTAGSDFHGIRDRVPFHAMLGFRSIGEDAFRNLKHVLRRRRL